METKLYPGIPFSPPAALTDNVGAGDTIIPVSNVEVFPPAPNLAVIGTDEEGETIEYAAKTATALSGCTRGVEGVAKAWTKGEPIARNWTAKDHEDLIAAVGEADTAAQDANKAAQEAKEGAEPKGTAEAAVRTHDSGSTAHEDLFAAKQNKLVGQPGQVVGFDGMGLAYAIRGWSNPNLLDNWYFADPVNQGGQTEYAKSGYTIDRWLLFTANAKVTITNGGVKLSGSEAKTGGCGQLFYAADFANGVYTFSALTADNDMASGQIIIDGSSKTVAASFLTDGTIQILYKPNIIGFGDKIIFGLYAEKTFIALKFELGDRQTLAHKVGGTWVLNDPPPNKALELEKCQRHMYNPFYNASGKYNRLGLGYRGGESRVNILIPLPTTMRGRPTVTNLSNMIIREIGDPYTKDVVSISTDSNSILAGSITLTCNLEEDVAADGIYVLSPKDGMLGSLILDANL